MSAAQAGAALAAHRVDLVDEDDGGGLLLGLVKQVPDPAGAYAHVQLHKVGAGDGQEVDSGLSGHRFGDQRLASARRAHQQHALGDAGPQGDELLGVPEKLHDLLELLLLLVRPGHVVEGDLLALVGQGAGAGVAEPAGAGAAAGVGVGLAQVHHIPEGAHHQNDNQVGQQAEPPAGLDARLVVAVHQHAAGPLLVDKLVQVIVEDIEVGHLVVEGAGGVALPPNLQGEVVALQGEGLDPLLFKQGPHLAVGGISGLIHPLERGDSKDHQQNQHQIEDHVPGTESLQRGCTSFPAVLMGSPPAAVPEKGEFSPRRPPALKFQCRAGCGSARRSPDRNPPQRRRGW